MAAVTLRELADKGSKAIHDRPLKTQKFANLSKNPALQQVYDTKIPENVMVTSVEMAGAAPPQGGVGRTTSDVAWKAAMVRDYIYRAADIISVGTKLAFEEITEDLESSWYWPTEIQADRPGTEIARGPLRRVEWQRFTNKLFKTEVNFVITDESYIRGKSKLQEQVTLQRAAEAMALKKDEEILQAIYDGANSSGAATDNWDNLSSDDRDVPLDIATGVMTILDSEGVMPSEISKLKLVLGVRFIPVFDEIRYINNVQQSYRSYFANSHGIEILFTKTLAKTSSEPLYDSALLVVEGYQTAIHQVLKPPANIPTAEVQRQMASGWDYNVRQWYGTVVVPIDQDDADSYRIYEISNIRA